MKKSVKHIILLRNRKQLQTIGGVLMVVCAFLVILASLEGTVRTIGAQLLLFETAPWLFLAGAMIFAFAQRGLRTPSDMTPEDSRKTLAIGRLYTIQTWSHVMFVLSGLLMVEKFNCWLLPLFTGSMDTYQMYMQLIYNNWVVLMLIGALIQLYTVFRLSAELKKESKL